MCIRDRPWVYSVDPHLGWGIKFSKDSMLTIGMDIFNIFNFQAVTRVDERYTLSSVQPVLDATDASALAPCSTPTAAAGEQCLRNEDGTPYDQSTTNKNFGQATQYQAPRQFRFTARVTF